MTKDETAGRGGEQVPLSEEAAVRDILACSVLGLWEVVNNLTRLRPTRRDRYRVTFFGSARVDPGHWVYAAVRDTAAELTRMGCDIVTGGGPGLMRAANEGVKLADPDGRQKSVGIRVELPFEQDVNAFVTEAFEHRTFFTRLHHFVLVSDAFVLCPGGIGTVLELLMVWQLLQVRKLHDTPLLLAGHFWDGLLGWAREVMLRPDFALVSPEDLAIPRVVADGAAILQAIREHHAEWKRRQGGPDTPRKGVTP
ncbi:MAG: LOG family protein [Gemmataceae bacterium]